MRFVILGLLAFLVGCAPARFVEPLEKEQWSVGGNVGGPMVAPGGAPIPTPLSAVEVGYGLRDDLTVYGGLHVTSLLFGTGQLDFGATYKLLNQEKYVPNLSTSLGANFAYSPSTKSARFWPTLDLNMYWNYGKRRSYFYVGMNNYFDLSSTLAHDQKQRNHIVFSPQIGHVFKATNDRYHLFAEIKFIAPYADNGPVFTPFFSVLGSAGATGVYIGFRKMIGKTKKENELESEME